MKLGTDKRTGLDSECDHTPFNNLAGNYALLGVQKTETDCVGKHFPQVAGGATDLLGSSSK